MSFASTLRVETKYEFLKLVRLPAYAVPILIFPLMFYALFGLAFAGRSASSVTVATYQIAVMGAFGVIGAAMFGLGVGVAGERGQGWMTVKRASPMPGHRESRVSPDVVCVGIVDAVRDAAEVREEHRAVVAAIPFVAVGPRDGGARSKSGELTRDCPGCSDRRLSRARRDRISSR